MRERLRNGWYALVPATVALVLGLWGISTPGPWLDERFTIEAITDGLGSHAWDAPMWPYYGLMWLWSGGGSLIDEGWLRLPSVLSVSAAAATAALVASRIAGRKAGFAAGMLLALAPGVSRYGQEARTYALAMALVTIATLALLRAANGESRTWWAVYGGCLGVATLILPVSLAVLPAHLVILSGIQGWRRHLRDWVATLLFLVPIIALEGLLALWFSGTRAWLAAPEVTDLPQALTMVASSEYTGPIVPVVLVALAALTRTGLRWLGAIAVSAVGIWVVSVTLGSWWLARGFLPLSGLLCVAAGLALARVDWLSLAVVLGVVVLIALPDLRSVREPGARGTDPTEISALVDEFGEFGDVIYVPPQGSLLAWSVQHYLRDDPRFVEAGLPSSGRHWELGPEPSCVEFREWQLAGDGVLRLCL